MGEKTEGRNPNARRKSNGTKALSNGEFMIACVEMKILLMLVLPRTLLTTGPLIMNLPLVELLPLNPVLWNEFI